MENTTAGGFIAYPTNRVAGILGGHSNTAFNRHFKSRN
jgi:hypothetical protein